MTVTSEPTGKSSAKSTAWSIFLVFLRLGLTSFGGPIAHLGYFRSEFVERRKWFDEKTYGDLVALCQFLPGPASSQVGIAVGMMRGGYPGAIAAWLGFTAPSALALVLFAYGVTAFGGWLGSGWLHGLKIAAVAVVAQAVLGMMRTLAPDRERATLAVLAAAIVLAIPSAWAQIVAIALGGVAGLLLLNSNKQSIDDAVLPLTMSRSSGSAFLMIFFVLLLGLPLLTSSFPIQGVRLFEAFYRAGSLVFGGGHVVLPLLQASVVPPGWVTNDAFLAGYGAAQAVPGPLFTFAAYLGAIMGPEPNGWAGAMLCLVAIFLPSFLLVLGALPFWDQLRRHPKAQSLLAGVNAAVVGLLLAALYNPVWTAGISTGADFALACGAFLLLYMWQTPPWAVVLICALGSAAIAAT